MPVCANELPTKYSKYTEEHKGLCAGEPYWRGRRVKMKRKQVYINNKEGQLCQAFCMNVYRNASISIGIQV